MGTENIPEAFLGRMKEMLGEEYPAFIQCYEEEPAGALRLNPLKKREGNGDHGLPFRLTPVPWTSCGYYYDPKERPGRHPLHEAGVYYIQEASAMAPGVCLQAQPGERVLDLCAAPGGKSTQAAADMQNGGLLVCNEIHHARAKILSENIERMGVSNALVTNETPRRLAQRFPGFFDRILVDAPCSGEGMFRKNEEARREWNLQNVENCAERQDEILDCAAALLRPGGRLVYSTCTFAPQENEGSISRFLLRHPEFAMTDSGLEDCCGMTPGVPEWADYPAQGLERAVRLWPHRLRGEGHFAAVMRKEGKGPGDQIRREGVYRQTENKWFTEFEREYLRTEFHGVLFTYGEQLYLAPEQTPDLQKLKVLRPGLHLGTLKKKRFEPSHALALALGPQETVLRRKLSEEEANAWMKGETLPCGNQGRGWCLMEMQGYSIGWGKAAGGLIKNHYPKGLRRNYGI